MINLSLLHFGEDSIEDLVLALNFALKNGGAGGEETSGDLKTAGDIKIRLIPLGPVAFPVIFVGSGFPNEIKLGQKALLILIQGRFGSHVLGMERQVTPI